MSPQKLRHTMIGLLMVTGVFHFAVALFGDADGIRLPLAAFGFVYSGLAFYIRKDVSGADARPIVVTLVATATGLALGTMTYLSNDGPGALLIMLGVDVVIIAAGLAWFMKRSQKKT